MNVRNEDEVSERAERCMEYIESQGEPPLPKADYCELLEQIVSECQVRLEAVREEIENESGEA